MTDDEVIDLLSVVTAYDKRTTGQGELNAWAESARRGRWTMDEAVNAVHEHYATSTDWIMPGHVTQRIKARRSEPPRSGALPSATPRPASDEHKIRIAAWLRERFHAERDEHTAETRRCVAVECPQCAADPSEPCVQTRRRSARRLPIEIPHVQRRWAYRQNQEDDHGQ